MRYYRILGVSRTASQKEIKKAFRRLSVKYHPDKNQGDPRAEEKMKEINDAYSVIGNPEKRHRYDLENGLKTVPASRTGRQSNTRQRSYNSARGISLETLLNMMGMSDRTESTYVVEVEVNVNHIINKSKVSFNLGNKRYRITLPGYICNKVRMDGREIHLSIEGTYMAAGHEFVWIGEQEYGSYTMSATACTNASIKVNVDFEPGQMYKYNPNLLVRQIPTPRGIVKNVKPFMIVSGEVMEHGDHILIFENMGLPCKEKDGTIRDSELLIRCR